MKKCKKCGAVQNDDRTTCVDCGTLLGRPMTEEEEEMAEAALDDKLYAMSERTEDFYVPVRDKIMGVLCIVGVIAAILLLNFAGVEKAKLKNDVPSDVMVTYENGAFVTAYGTGTDGAVLSPAFRFPSSRYRTLEEAQAYALISLISFIAAGPMLFFPRFMWFLDTLKYRIFYNWDTTPSYFAIVCRKIATYFLFVLGVGTILYAYWLYL